MDFQRRLSKMDKEEFKKTGYAFIDWVSDYLTEVGSYPVKSEVMPGQIRNRLPLEAPLEGEQMEEIFKDFQEIILPGITHWQHPNWFAYFPANNSPASILAELLTAGIGAQCMVWQTSPAAAELEEVVLKWLREILGLPKNMEGVIQDTASTATLCALLTAREVATDFEANRKGVSKTLVVYASEEAHSSIEKGVKIAGYGREYLRFIPTDEAYALIPAKLEEAIIKDKQAGLHPACVVATLGTTSSLAIDPLEAISEICQRHGIWLHVDAAFAGTAALLEEHRLMLKGIEKVDSFVFNPHKWMLTNFDCSVYFVKNPDLLVKTFEIHPEYLKTGMDEQVKNYRDWGIQLGRRFRALKLWFVIRSYGVKGLQEMVRKHLALAQTFKEWVEQDNRFEVMAPVNLSLVCFRLIIDGASESELERINEQLLERVNATGRAFLSHTSLKGRYVLRMNIAQRTTEEKHIKETWELIKEKASEILI